PDPALRPPSVTNEKREEVIEMMIASLTIIYRFFEPHRWSLALTPPDVPLRREGPKIGRNAPCPCSSGRKFKNCCGSNSPTMH
ncbi:YecA family protein, partial [Pseudomonas syringae pv. avii]